MTKITDKKIYWNDGSFVGWLWKEYKNTISTWKYDAKGNVVISRGFRKSCCSGWGPEQSFLDDDLRGVRNDRENK